MLIWHIIPGMISRSAGSGLVVVAVYWAGLAAGPAAAAPAGGSLERVTDFEGSLVVHSSTPAELTVAGGWVYFRARDPRHGVELWRTDGSPDGAERVADLCPGDCSSEPRQLGAMGDTLLFVAADSPGRPELWASDGTEAGTVPLAPVFHDFAFLVPNAIDDRLTVFAASDRETGIEPWVTDGTPEGTALLADLCPGPCSSFPTSAARLPGALVFAAAHTFGGELYRTDGTPAGTTLLADLCPGECGSRPSSLTTIGERVFLSADDGVHGREPWITDGTQAGTRPLANLASGPAASEPRPLIAYAGLLYFSARTALGILQHWRTDGTPEGTVRAPELEPRGPDVPAAGFAVAGGRLHFGVPSGSTEELWALDGPGGTPRLLRGGFLGIRLGSDAGGRAALGDRLVFAADSEGSSMEPWITDGTTVGTHLLLEIGWETEASSPAWFTPSEGRLMFAATRLLDRELWTTDGTRLGTATLENIVPSRPKPEPERLAAFDGRLYFYARDRDGPSLWRHRPGAGKPELVTREPLGDPAPVAGRLFFIGGHGPGLSILDPETDRPVEIFGFGAQAAPIPLGERFLFANVQVQELYTTDGTVGGTELVRAWPGPCNDAPLPLGHALDLTRAGQAVYLLIETPDCVKELWRSDGTAAGTVRVETPGTEPLALASLANRQLLVVARTGFSGFLWTPGGAGEPSGTTLGGLGPVLLVRVFPAGDLVYVLTFAGLGEYRLWRSDGTADGTFLLARLFRTVSGFPEAVVAGGRLFFSEADEEHGHELWVTDGTVAGTRMVCDIRPGPRSSLPSVLAAAGDGVLFAADEGEAGHEPWLSDGTAAGTVRLADVAPGREASSPGELAALGERVYFDADDGGPAGRQLWSVTLIEDPELPPSDATEVDAPELAGFRLWVRITAAGEVQPTRREAACIPETVCVSGAVPGRSELFVRIVGPKPNGFLWPTLVRFSTSEIEVWIEQLATGVIRHYRLPAAQPGSSELPGLFDRQGFEP